MGKTTLFSTALLNTLLNNANLANVGDATGIRSSTTNGSLYLSLHTSDPGVGGTQTTNETSYTSYARVPIARDGTGWTVSAGSAQNTNLESFPTCTGGSATITHFGIGTASAGAGELLYSGALTTPLAVSNGVTPQFLATALTVTEN